VLVDHFRLYRLLANDSYQSDLFPSVMFRVAYDYLREHDPVWSKNSNDVATTEKERAAEARYHKGEIDVSGPTPLFDFLSRMISDVGQNSALPR
jgi:hypothetical protein